MQSNLGRFLRRLGSFGTSARKQERRKGLPKRLVLERLEDRTLLSSMLTLVGGTLTYSAGAGDTNDLSVSFNSGAPSNYEFHELGGVTITTTIAGETGSGTSDVTVPTTGITSVVVDVANNGNIVAVPSTQAGVPTTVNTGTGTDTVNLGSDPTFPGFDSTLDTIQGPVTIHGNDAAPSDTLNLIDSGNPASSTYVLTSNALNRTGAATVTYDQMALVNLLAQSASGDKTFDVQSTAAGTSYFIGGSEFNSTANLGDNTNVLDGIQGPLSVFSVHNLNINDQGNVAPGTYVVTTGAFQRTAPATAPVSYSFVAAFTINAGNADNVFNMQSTASGTTYTLNTGTGADTINAGDTFHNVNNLLGEVDIVSQDTDPSDTLNFNDQGDTAASAYIITSSEVARTFTALIMYDNLAAVNVNGGSGGNTFEVDSTLAGTSYVLSTGVGADTVTIGNFFNGLSLILGNMTVHGQDASPSATLNLDDSGGGSPTNSYLLTATAFQRTNPETALISYDGMATMNVTPIGETFNVQSTAAGTTYTVGPLYFTANIGDATNHLDGIQGPLSFQGLGLGLGINNLNFNDQGTTMPATYVVTATTFQRTTPAMAQVTYNMVEAVNINAGSGGNTVNVQSTATDIAYTVATGAGPDIVNVGDLTNTLDGIQGPLAIHGGGIDLLEVVDEGNTVGHTYTLTTGMLQRNDMANITYDGVGTFVLAAANNPYFGHTMNTVYVQSFNLVTAIVAVGAGDRITVGQQRSMAGILGELSIESATGQVPALITLDDSADTTARTITLQGNTSTPDYLVSGLLPNGEPISLQVDPATPVSILGGSADKVFSIHDFTGAPAISLVAEPPSSTRPNQHNKLDYSGYTGPVLVSLPLGYATGFAAISGIQDVTGSHGNNLLVGDRHPNILIGGTGRNVLIAGGGGDTLDASQSQGDNILIGGRTDWDMNLSALQAIMSEWDRTDLNFANRRSDLLNGTNSQGLAPENIVGSQLILLKPATNPTSSNGTVHADGTIDTLIGSNFLNPATGKRAVHNWFLYSLNPMDMLVNYDPTSDKKDKIT